MDFQSAEQLLTWQESESSNPVTESALILWSGEILLRTGRGVEGGFHSSEEDAKTEARAIAASLPSGDVFQQQLVRYACAESLAAQLASLGTPEFQRINRFWVSPIRALATLEICGSTG